MAGPRALFLLGFLVPALLLPEAANILTVSSLGGSHYLLFDRVSQILQDHGHNVTMLHFGRQLMIQSMTFVIVEFSYTRQRKTMPNLYYA
nr:UDP-glucuronosyltransferase 3A2-like [Manis javanica]